MRTVTDQLQCRKCRRRYTVSPLYCIQHRANRHRHRPYSIYDSLRKKPSDDTIRTIAKYLQSAEEKVTIQVMNVDKQPNGHDCGLYSIVFATSLRPSSYRIVSYRIGVEDAGLSLYVLIFITNFNTKYYSILTHTSVSGSGNVTFKIITYFLVSPKLIQVKLSWSSQHAMANYSIY